METFEGGGSSSKVWVKAGTYDAGSRSKFTMCTAFALLLITNCYCNCRGGL